MGLGGSFEPGKVFNISAVVADPALGQTLTLELPKGMHRLEGKDVQAVAPLTLPGVLGTDPLVRQHPGRVVDCARPALSDLSSADLNPLPRD